MAINKYIESKAKTNFMCKQLNLNLKTSMDKVILTNEQDVYKNYSDIKYKEYKYIIEKYSNPEFLYYTNPVLYKYLMILNTKYYNFHLKKSDEIKDLIHLQINNSNVCLYTIYILAKYKKRLKQGLIDNLIEGLLSTYSIHTIVTNIKSVCNYEENNKIIGNLKRLFHNHFSIKYLCWGIIPELDSILSKEVHITENNGRYLLNNHVSQLLMKTAWDCYSCDQIVFSILDFVYLVDYEKVDKDVIKFIDLCLADNLYSWISSILIIEKNFNRIMKIKFPIEDLKNTNRLKKIVDCTMNSFLNFEIVDTGHVSFKYYERIKDTLNNSNPPRDTLCYFIKETFFEYFRKDEKKIKKFMLEMVL